MPAHSVSVTAASGMFAITRHTQSTSGEWVRRAVGLIEVQSLRSQYDVEMAGSSLSAF